MLLANQFSKTVNFNILVEGKRKNTKKRMKIQGYLVKQEEVPYNLIVHRKYNERGNRIPGEGWHVSEYDTGLGIKMYKDELIIGREAAAFVAIARIQQQEENKLEKVFQNAKKINDRKKLICTLKKQTKKPHRNKSNTDLQTTLFN